MRPFTAQFILKAFHLLAPYIGNSLLVMVLSVFLGSLLGALLAWGRLSHSKTARTIAAFYVHLMRCTPSIVLLLLVYYGLPQLFFCTLFPHRDCISIISSIIDSIENISLLAIKPNTSSFIRERSPFTHDSIL